MVRLPLLPSGPGGVHEIAVHRAWAPQLLPITNIPAKCNPASTDRNSAASLAERVGFEPTVRFRTHAFQACTLSHSVISPLIYQSPVASACSLAERVGFEPTCLLTETKRFRGAPVMATSVPLRILYSRSSSSIGEPRRVPKKSSSMLPASSASTPPRQSKR